MTTLELEVKEKELKRFGLKGRKSIRLSELVETIKDNYVKEALEACQIIASKTELKQMSLDEINAEIKSARNDKNHS